MSGARRRRGAKTPFYMYGGDGELLFMGGLWSTWRPKDAPEGHPAAAELHHHHHRGRGPAGRDPRPHAADASASGDWDHWLDPDAPIDEGLLRGHGDLDRIEIREVSRLVNSVRNNGPELIEPAEPEPEQATLL